jgi:hypothetical protein
VKAVAIADMAGSDCSVGGFADARCLSEKSARNRRARGVDSEINVSRSVATVVSTIVCGERG